MDLWSQIKSMYEESGRQIKILDGVDEQGLKEVNKMSISLESTMGTIVVNTNGIIVDNWIRILGQSSEHHAGIADFNKRIGYDFGKMMIVAIDIVGGLFALNTGEYEDDIDRVWYFAPDTVSWESLGFKYSEFIAWIAQGNIMDFYEPFRWNGWEKDVENIDGFNKGVLVYPFLWSKECNIETAAKKISPLSEIIKMNYESFKNVFERGV